MRVLQVLLMGSPRRAPGRTMCVCVALSAAVLCGLEQRHVVLLASPRELPGSRQSESERRRRRRVD